MDEAVLGGEVHPQGMYGDILGGVMSTGEEVTAAFSGFVPTLFTGFPCDQGVTADGGSFEEVRLAATGDDSDAAEGAVQAGAMQHGMGKCRG